MNYNIEVADINHLDEILNIQMNHKHDLISESALKSDLNNIQNIYLVAKNTSGNIIGCIGASNLVDHVDISIIITDINYLKKGVASSLLMSIVEYCKKQNINKIFLEVRKSNIAAIKLYEKTGFNQISIRKNYYADTNEDALIYMLEI